MLSVAEFTIAPAHFPFGKTLTEMPDIEISVDQIVPTDETALPYFWVTGCQPETFIELAEHEPEIRQTQLLDQLDDTILFRAEWQPNAEVIAGLKELDLTIVEAIGNSTEWRFEVRTANRSQFQAFRETFEANDIPIELTRLYDWEEVIEPSPAQLTDKQREVLIAAYEAGYFDSPRQRSQGDLGEQFGISNRAVSERLRRGTRNLIRGTLIDDASADPQRQ